MNKYTYTVSLSVNPNRLLIFIMAARNTIIVTLFLAWQPPVDPTTSSYYCPQLLL